MIIVVIMVCLVLVVMAVVMDLMLVVELLNYNLPKSVGGEIGKLSTHTH